MIGLEIENVKNPGQEFASGLFVFRKKIILHPKGAL